MSTLYSSADGPSREDPRSEDSTAFELEPCPARAEDRALLVELALQANAQEQLGVGYPRWESWAEVVAEFDVYGSSPELGLYALTQRTPQPARILGYTGFLADPAERSGFLIGPVVSGEARAAVSAALHHVESLAAQRFDRLRACVTVQNETLRSALRARGWQALKQQLEMKLLRADLPTATGDARISELDASSTVEVAAAGALLVEGLGWQGDGKEQLLEYCEHCQVRIARAGSQVVGVVIADAMEGTDFCRIEDLAVAAPARRQGFGRALLLAALRALPERGQEVFLSVDTTAQAAITLYRQLGFQTTRCAELLEKRWTAAG